ncbi:hypothetical protein P692DRAFT_20218101 [Suillus brevipes Sb2]|nr:hypothetical protein P692DRAFT_20218101 [Suillus brevipes Sb2]
MIVLKLTTGSSSPSLNSFEVKSLVHLDTPRRTSFIAAFFPKDCSGNANIFNSHLPYITLPQLTASQFPGFSDVRSTKDDGVATAGAPALNVLFSKSTVMLAEPHDDKKP